MRRRVHSDGLFDLDIMSLWAVYSKLRGDTTALLRAAFDCGCILTSCQEKDREGGGRRGVCASVCGAMWCRRVQCRQRRRLCECQNPTTPQPQHTQIAVCSCHKHNVFPRELNAYKTYKRQRMRAMLQFICTPSAHSNAHWHSSHLQAVILKSIMRCVCHHKMPYMTALYFNCWWQHTPSHHTVCAQAW